MRYGSILKFTCSRKGTISGPAGISFRATPQMDAIFIQLGLTALASEIFPFSSVNHIYSFPWPNGPAYNSNAGDIRHLWERAVQRHVGLWNAEKVNFCCEYVGLA